MVAAEIKTSAEVRLECASMTGAACTGEVTHRDASFTYCAACAARRAAAGVRTRKLKPAELRRMRGEE